MPNQHENTAQIRGPIRAVQRLRLLAGKRGWTLSNTLDFVVNDFLARHDPEILTVTSDLPEPRRSMPSGTPAPPVPIETS